VRPRFRPSPEAFARFARAWVMKPWSAISCSTMFRRPFAVAGFSNGL
jgi:hypothetical protein